MSMELVLFTNPHLHELNPTQCGRERCTSRHSYGPAVRDWYLLHYVVSGKGIFTTHGVTYSLGTGDIFIIRPYELTYYEADAQQPWEYIWVGFQAAVPLPQTLREQDVCRLAYAHPLFEAMIQTAHMDAGREACLCGYVWQLLGKMQAQEGAPKNTPAHAVELAVSCIEAEYPLHVSVGELAARLHLDRSYFSTLFRKQMGKSPQQYLVEVRLSKAAELMAQYGYSPGEAAASVGYPDIFSFSKMFKRHYGCAPSMYEQK